MLPVVSDLTCEYNKRPRRQVQILALHDIVIRWSLFEMHRNARLQTQAGEDFLEWGVRIDMWGYALPRRVVI